MPDISQIVKFRNRRRSREQRVPWVRIALVFTLCICLFLVMGSLVGFWFYTDLTHSLPSIQALPRLLEPPGGTLLQPTRLYDRTGQNVILTLEDPGVAEKQYLHVGTDDQPGTPQFSPYLIEATTAEFDPGFWQHPGYSLAGVNTGAHPTIAQRLVSDLLLEAVPPSLRRNLGERLMAAQITARFGRDKILEWYLNSAQYGELVYGADAAAWAYLGKSAATLNLGEATLLAVMAENPASHPISIAPALKDLQELLITSMLESRLIEPAEAQQALLEEIHLRRPSEVELLAPAFTRLVLVQLGSVMPLERLYRGGYVIVTSLNYELQLQAACASQVLSDRLKGLSEQQMEITEVPCEAAQLLPTLPSAQAEPLQDVNLEVVILDPHTGQVLAMVGDESGSTLPDYPGRHPAGTIVSPFLYLAAFAQGMSPGTLIWDIPKAEAVEGFVSEQGGASPIDPASYHGPVRLRMAWVNDYPAAALNVLQQVGADDVWLAEQSFGVTLSKEEHSSAATLDELYSQPISLMEGVQAYAVLANQGVMVGQPDLKHASGSIPDPLSPTSVLRVSGVDGSSWLDWSNAQSRPIISTQLAYLATHVLSDESARWPGLEQPTSLDIRRPAAVKLGSTTDGNNAWAIGYIPQLAVGVWMGHSQAEEGGVTGEMPAGLWHAIVQYASNQMPVVDFSTPAGINKLQVCDPSGLLPSKLCPEVVEEVFLDGNEPTQEDDLYQNYYLNRETGLLATIFTPSNLIEEKVYLVVPLQALAWAQQAGMPIPPTTYEAVNEDRTASTDVQITAPQMFVHVRGQIVLTGSATGDDFSYYRLQVGQGRNPHKWLQVGEDVLKPVQDAVLGTWDTSGLEGEYVLQLLVVRRDQRIERANLLLTIDNTSPEVSILSPMEAEKLAVAESGKIMLQLSASDNLEVGKIEFYVEGNLIGTLYQPPFIILWPAQPGEHKLLAKVYDLAGNIGVAETIFSVVK